MASKIKIVREMDSNAHCVSGSVLTASAALETIYYNADKAVKIIQGKLFFRRVKS